MHQLSNSKDSFAPIMNSHAQEILHNISIKHCLLLTLKERGGRLDLYQKSENQLITCISMAIKIEFMCKFISSIAIYMLTIAVLTSTYISIVYQDSNQQPTYLLYKNYGCCVKMKQQWKFFVTISSLVYLESIIGNGRKNTNSSVNLPPSQMKHLHC